MSHEWRDRIRNENLWERLEVESLIETIKRKHFQWFGHVMRKGMISFLLFNHKKSLGHHHLKRKKRAENKDS